MPFDRCGRKSRAVAELTTQLGYPATEDEIRRRYDLIKDRSDARLLRRAGRRQLIVGWIHVQATYLLECDARAEIWGLVVAESARGTGVGRRLVEAAEEWALMRGLGVDGRAIESTARPKRRASTSISDTKVTKTQNAFRRNGRYRVSARHLADRRHEDLRLDGRRRQSRSRGAKGALYGFIGPNGAGKTTTLRMIMSILFPDRGELSVLGRPAAIEAKDRIGYLPEERGVYRKMKVGAFLIYMARLKGRAATSPRARGSVARAA